MRFNARHKVQKSKAQDYEITIKQNEKGPAQIFSSMI